MTLSQMILQTALNQAQKAFDCDEVPVGAVIFHTQSQKIIAYAHNQTQMGKNPLLHAEIIAITKACDILQSKNLSGYSIFITLEPCAMCASALSLARIDNVFFAALDPKTGGILQGPKIYTHTQLHHKPHTEYGFIQEECSTLLTTFFKMKRLKK